MKILNNREYRNLLGEIEYLRESNNKHIDFIKGILEHKDLFKKAKIPVEIITINKNSEGIYLEEDIEATRYTIPQICIVDIKRRKK